MKKSSEHRSPFQIDNWTERRKDSEAQSKTKVEIPWEKKHIQKRQEEKQHEKSEEKEGIVFESI